MTDQEHAKAIRDAHARLNSIIEKAKADLFLAETVRDLAIEHAAASGMRVMNQLGFSPESNSSRLHPEPELSIIRAVSL